MQLRVPKKYLPQQRRRRRLISRRFVVLFLATTGLAVLGYSIMQNPQPVRQGAENFVNNMEAEIANARERMFPEQPTATPDVRAELVECDNAYLVGNWEAVISICGEALTGQPNNVDLHYRVGYTLVITSNGGADTQRINAALEMATKTITANPESPVGWAIKAMVLDWAGEHNLALAAAQRALELDPNSVIAKINLANIYRNVGSTELALTTIEEAINTLEQRGGNNELRAQAYRNYGRILATVPNYEGALAAYEVARQAMPSHTYISIEMIGIYISLAVTDPSYDDIAFQLIEDALRVSPRDVTLLNSLAQYHIRKGEIPQAQESFTRCLTVNADYIPCLSQSGQLHYPVGEYPQAIEKLGHATELGSQDPYDWYLLGRAYFRLQQCNLAAEPLREGYRLIQEVESSQVAIENFETAFRECNLPIPPLS